MNILWFVNIPFPEVRKRLGLPLVGGSGFWMTELLKSLKKDTTLNISLAWSGRPCWKPMAFSVDNTKYYCTPETRWEDIGFTKQKLLHHWQGIIEQVQPDLIEFHGTEKYHGLLAGMIQVPTLVSIQGILGECVKYCFGPLNIKRRLRYSNVLRLCASYKIRSFTERRIFKCNTNYVGRTDWDEGLLRLINPESIYYSCPRIVRKPFRHMYWSRQTVQEPPLIVSTASGKPLKGCDVLIKAAGELNSRGISFRLIFLGDFPEKGYGAYLRKLIQKLMVDDKISFAGYAEPEKMIEIYLKASVFVIPSYIENSPNALAEAMCLGMPCIGSRTGGIPSMLEDGSTGMLFRNGNHIELADHIHSLILDHNFAEDLGLNARRKAMREHDPIIVADTMKTIYSSVIEQTKTSNDQKCYV